jgi:hypothetical protein
MFTAGHGACFVYDLEITLESKKFALSKLSNAGLEPVILVNGDPHFAVAISTAKVNKEPWRYKRLPGSTDTEHDAEDSRGFERRN